MSDFWHMHPTVGDLPECDCTGIVATIARCVCLDYDDSADPPHPVCKYMSVEDLYDEVSRSASWAVYNGA